MLLIDSESKCSKATYHIGLSAAGVFRYSYLR